jgi:hypothetical protein
MQAAPRFVLDYHLVALTKDIPLPTIAVARESIRLPYNYCWFEFTAEGTDTCVFIGNREAFKDDNLYAYTTATVPDEGSFTFEMYSYISTGRGDKMAQVNPLPISLFCFNNAATIDSGAIESEMSHEDVQATVIISGINASIITSALLLMNQPKLCETKVIKSKINSIKLKSGRVKKIKPKQYTLIRVSDTLKQYIREDDENVEIAGKRKLHYKRGHFKVRKTGIFWWRSHMAGKGGVLARKDYSVVE